MQANGMTPDDVDWLIPHQANMRIIEAVCSAPASRANAASSTSTRPRTRRAHRCRSRSTKRCVQGKIKPGQTLLFCALGAAIAWGSALRALVERRAGRTGRGDSCFAWTTRSRSSPAAFAASAVRCASRSASAGAHVVAADVLDEAVGKETLALRRAGRRQGRARALRRHQQRARSTRPSRTSTSASAASTSWSTTRASRATSCCCACPTRTSRRPSR